MLPPPESGFSQRVARRAAKIPQIQADAGAQRLAGTTGNGSQNGASPWQRETRGNENHGNADVSFWKLFCD